MNTQHTKEPVCPHCGRKERDAWEVDFGPAMDGEAVIVCGYCEKEYKVERFVSIEFTTSKL